ncbi:calcium-binding protein [Inquilinus limosus]|uniref:calcium-binding protein n=1 Tax=Inquilinus limosus TaxID=171674 RepID=UPI003F138746
MATLRHCSGEAAAVAYDADGPAYNPLPLRRLQKGDAVMATVSYSWANVVSDFTLNDFEIGNQGDVAIAATSGGLGYRGAWCYVDDHVEARTVGADGTPTGGSILVNATTEGNQFDPSAATLSNGGTVVSFTDQSTGTDVVRWRILGTNNRYEDFALPGTDQPQRESDVTALSSGGFAIAFTRDWGSGNTDLQVQRYNADGTLNGGAILVDTSTTLATDHASVAGLASGGLVVAWEQSASAGGSHSVWFQLYNSAGAAVGGHHSIDSTGTINQDIQVAALRDGGFVVAYTDNGWGTGTDIAVQVFNADGSARSGHLRANSTTAGDQGLPTITVLSNGYFVVGWNDGESFYYQAYNQSGTALGANHAVDTLTLEGEIAGLADGLIASVRESEFGDDSGTAIRSSVDALVRTTVGTAANEVLDGDSLRDVMDGGAGDDVLRGGAGGDTLNGGAGIDTASYYTGSTGITVSLLTGTGSGGDAAGDTLTGIENISGSQGVDSLVGNDGANVLQGWAGNDILNGARGKDTLTGGAGADRFVYGGTIHSPVGAGADRITDFSHAQGDRIDLSIIDANTSVSGNQAFSFIGTGLYTGTAGQLRYAVSGGVTTVAGDVNGDGTSDFHIQLTGSIVLVAGDFVL